MTAPKLLFCAPSTGFGGGIERVATAVERHWPGSCARVDLYRSDRVAHPYGQPRVKAGFAVRCMKEALRTRPDVILCLHVGLLPVAQLAARAMRCEVALLGVGREVWGTLPTVTRRRVQACQRLLAISGFTADVLAHRAEVSRTRVDVVWLPVAAGMLEAAESKLRADSREPLLLTVSRVVREHRYKGHFTVARSLPEVLVRNPNARWVVVGDGDDIPALQAECEGLGVMHAVSFEQRVSDGRLVELYRRAQVMVMPSVTDTDRQPPVGEGFGLVYAEAAAFAVPSIASSSGGGAAELVEDMVTGLTVPPQNASALATAINTLLEDDDLRGRLGGEARNRVIGRHVPPRFAEALHHALAA